MILKNKLKGSSLLLAVAFMVILVAGCNPVGGEGDSVSTYQPEDCPDDYVYTKEVTMTTGINEWGNPIDDTILFSTDIAEIFSVFSISQDLCCKDVIVEWYYGDQLLKQHVEMSSNYFVVSLKSPESGFERGDYEMVIFIDGNASLTRIPFSVV